MAGSCADDVIVHIFFFLWLGYIMTIRKIIVENRGSVEPIEIVAWFTGKSALLGCRPGSYRPWGLPARRRCAIRDNWEVVSAARISSGVDYFSARNPRLHPSCMDWFLVVAHALCGLREVDIVTLSEDPEDFVQLRRFLCATTLVLSCVKT